MLKNQNLFLEGKIATKKINNDIETWPNTTFAMVELNIAQIVVCEAVIIGPNIEITYASNIFCEDFKNEKKRVGVSWDVIVESESSNDIHSFISDSFINDNTNYAQDYAIMIIDKNYEEKY
jgi:hypothetical protein